jgi:tRNA (mo5U34)-methyltransferase
MRTLLKRRRKGPVGYWWHSIDLPAGTTPGHKSPDLLRSEWAALGLDDLSGKTVLDIGAWDGWFSFAAEQRGASRVVALDHYMWSLDLTRQRAYYENCLASGETPQPYETVPGLWRPDDLPGKAGFDTAKEALGSHVEDVVDDFMTMDLARLGTFDVVLFLGVLYHLRHPLLGLERLATVTRGSAYIETEAVVLPGNPTACEFYEGAELAGDLTNWWAPTPTALPALCRAAGFRDAELLNHPPSEGHYRAVIRADR